MLKHLNSNDNSLLDPNLVNCIFIIGTLALVGLVTYYVANNYILNNNNTYEDIGTITDPTLTFEQLPEPKNFDDVLSDLDNSVDDLLCKLNDSAQIMQNTVDQNVQNISNIVDANIQTGSGITTRTDIDSTQLNDQNILTLGEELRTSFQNFLSGFQDKVDSMTNYITEDLHLLVLNRQYLNQIEIIKSWVENIKYKINLTSIDSNTLSFLQNFQEEFDVLQGRISSHFEELQNLHNGLNQSVDLITNSTVNGPLSPLSHTSIDLGMTIADAKLIEAYQTILKTAEDYGVNYADYLAMDETIQFILNSGYF